MHQLTCFLVFLTTTKHFFKIISQHWLLVKETLHDKRSWFVLHINDFFTCNNLHVVILIGIENQQKVEGRLWSFRASISGKKRDPANRIGLDKGKACYCGNTGPGPWFWGHQTCWLTKWRVHKRSFSIVTISWHGKLWNIQAAGIVFLYHSSLMWGK